MQLTFLQADRPLIKRYTKQGDGSLKRESYTNAWKFTSLVEDATTLADFHAHLVAHASKGHCLHTGSLAVPLKDESRKGHHDKDERRQWIVIDLDELKGFSSAEDVIKELPPAFHDVSYIEQHSAGSGLKDGLNMHLFFILDREEHMRDVKNWVMHVNLTTGSLRDKITLTAKDYGLSYPLDRIANDNGRIIYIAPPECIGFADPVPDRIRLVKKQYDALRFAFSSSTVSDVREEERTLIRELRTAKGLTTSKAKEFYETRGEVDVLKKKLTERGRIHPVQKDNDLIIRCNLDDGDSEAYFYYIKYPQLLRNHKGEPCLFMDAVDPEYYNKVALPASKAEWEKDLQPFVFRNRYDDKWYVGRRKGEEIYEQPHVVGSEQKIAAYFSQHGGLGVPDPIPTWSREFNPTFELQWNPVECVFNTWRQSDIMRNATYRSKPPATIDRVIRHVVGGGDEEYHRFMNWLAYIFQNRTKTGTAWIFHGVQGTGKGLLVDHILTPMFGHDYVVKQQSRNLKAEFNGWMEQAIIVNLDEFDINDAGTDATSVMQALKMWITDNRLPIRAMHRESRMTNNYSNFILTTNSKSALYVDEGDRRINFGIRQEERLVISPAEVESLADEVRHFAGWLKGYDVNKTLAHTCLENQTKQHAKELSKSSIEEFVAAVHSGDIEYFVQARHEKAMDIGLAGEFNQILNHWVEDVRNGEATAVEPHELVVAYKLICGDERAKIEKFKKLMAHKSLPPKQFRHNGRRVRGWKIEWQADEETKRSLGLHLKAVKTSEELEEQLKAELASPK